MCQHPGGRPGGHGSYGSRMRSVLVGMLFALLLELLSAVYFLLLSELCSSVFNWLFNRRLFRWRLCIRKLRRDAAASRTDSDAGWVFSVPADCISSFRPFLRADSFVWHRAAGTGISNRATATNDAAATQCPHFCDRSSNLPRQPTSRGSCTWLESRVRRRRNGILPRRAGSALTCLSDGRSEKVRDLSVSCSICRSAVATGSPALPPRRPAPAGCWTGWPPQTGARPHRQSVLCRE